MIKQLEDHYWTSAKYDLIATSRNIWIFKNQWYFNQTYNLFKIKDVFKLILNFKRYDIVIDAEEYFMISAFRSMRLGKINVWYSNIPVRWLAYNHWIIYNDKQHSLLTTLDLIKKIWIKYAIPQNMEPLIYKEKDKIKVDDFLNSIDKLNPNNKLICMHTWWAETWKDRAWAKKNRVWLIKEILDKYEGITIFLSWTHFEKGIAWDIISKLDKKYNGKVINICWFFNIFEFAYLLEKCKLMISNDTWPMHLSACMWTKTIGLFGPELPSKYGPYPSNKNVWLYKWDGKACIRIHLAKWWEDINNYVNKIEIKDVLRFIEF